MNEAGLALEERPGDVEQLRHVRRAVHTLKGDSAACGYRELSELAHDLEDVLTPELAQQNAGLIPEVVLTAADTFHEMLAAYRNNLQPPAGGALREHIRRLLNKPATQAQDAPQPRRHLNGREYERLMIVEALRRGENVYNIALQLDPRSAASRGGFRIGSQMRSTAPAGCWPSARRTAPSAEDCRSIRGGALHHQNRGLDPQALPRSVRGFEYFRRAGARAASAAARPAGHPDRIGSRCSSRRASSPVMPASGAGRGRRSARTRRIVAGSPTPPPKTCSAWTPPASIR